MSGETERSSDDASVSSRHKLITKAVDKLQVCFVCHYQRQRQTINTGRSLWVQCR